LRVIKALKPEISQFFIFTCGIANNGIGEMKNEKNEPDSKDVEPKNVYTVLRKK